MENLRPAEHSHGWLENRNRSPTTIDLAAEKESRAVSSRLVTNEEEFVPSNETTSMQQVRNDRNNAMMTRTPKGRN